MSKNASQTLLVLSLFVAGTQRGTEEPLVARYGALDLPALAVNPAGESAIHLRTILRGRPHSAAAGIQSYDSGADAQLFTTQPVVMFPIVSSICQQPVKLHVRGCLPHGLGKLRGIVARAPANHHTGEQVCGRVADQRELGPPFASKQLIAFALHVIGAHVAALKPRGVDGCLRVLINQMELSGTLEDSPEKRLESPFFNRRFSA